MILDGEDCLTRLEKEAEGRCCKTLAGYGFH